MWLMNGRTETGMEFCETKTIFLKCMFSNPRVLLLMFSTSLFKTVENIFIMWRTNEDVKWREREYTIFEAIEKHTRTRYAYTSVEGVDREKDHQLDDMPR